jgi:hypothetical protein
MTSQLSAFVAAARAAELDRGPRHTHVFVDEPPEKPVARRRGWLARLRGVRLWQQECPEHQL